MDLYNLKNIDRLHIELSSRCNSNCPSCARNVFGSIVVPDLELTELSLEDIKNFFPVTLIDQVKYINFCGNLGDPGMAPDLIPILEYFRDTKTKGHLTQHVRTNAGMRNYEFWAKLGNFFKDTRPDPRLSPNDQENIFNNSGVVFSVDGLEDTNHIYRKNVIWDKVINNMKAYSENGGYGHGIWEFLIFDHNKHQIEEASKLANELGFKFVVKNPLGFGDYQGQVMPINTYDKDGKYEYSIWPANYDGIKTEVPNTKRYFHKETFLNFVPTLSDFSKNLSETTDIECRSTCQKDTQEIYVSAHGYLLPCCFMGGVFGQSSSNYSLRQLKELMNQTGLDKFSLRKNSLYKILTNPEFNNFFRKGWENKPVEDGRLLICVETCGKLSKIKELYNNDYNKNQG